MKWVISFGQRIGEGLFPCWGAVAHSFVMVGSGRHDGFQKLRMIWN